MLQMKAVKKKKRRENRIGEINFDKQGTIKRIVTVPDEPFGPFFEICGRDLILADIRIEPAEPLDVNLQPLQQVILFDREAPAIGWVATTKIYPNVLRFVAGRLYAALIARHQHDAEQGKGVWVPARCFQLYTEDLWAGCEVWLMQGSERQEALKQLQRGQVPLPKAI